jgi:tol-pal system protein YbgF
MVIRSASGSDFRFASIELGQRWLPLVVLLLLLAGASAAADAEGLPQPSPAPTPIPFMQLQTQTKPWPARALADLQTEINSGFASSSDEQAGLSGHLRQLRTSQQRLQDDLSALLAQAQTVKDEQAMAGRKLAQADTSPNNRGVVQLLNQVEALNGELNRLRGHMEVLANDISNAQKRQRDMYVDLDTRLRRMEQGGSASKKDQDTIAALEERIRKLEQGTATAATIPQPVASPAAAPVNPPAPVAAATPGPASANPPAAAAPAQSSSLPPASLSATDQAAIQRAYDNAYSNYRLSDYQGAIRGFDSFLKTYPKHVLAPNAQYWIGESYFHLRDYRAAIEAQYRLLGTYPESPKAADALLIIGTAETNLGDNPAARKTFEELISKYPASESADKAKNRLAKLK